MQPHGAAGSRGHHVTFAANPVTLVTFLLQGQQILFLQRNTNMFFVCLL